jgi:alpha-mannosidase
MVKERFMLRGAGIAALIVAAMFLPMMSRAQGRVLWQMGAFDRSSNEFKNEGIDYADPKSDPVYRIGESKEAQDWPRFQPGPANGMAGGRVHPFTILFSLDEKPRGVYRLEIAMLYETPRLSYLRVEVNGHAGVFYFQPKLDYGAGDWEGTFVPQTSTAMKKVEIPAEWMLQGANKIVLTALDEPAEAQNSLGSIALGHTGIIYDALKFTQSPNEKYAMAALDAAIWPTIFYTKKDKVDAEIVETLLEISRGPRTGTVRLRIAGKSQEQRLDCPGEFGECRIEFAMPEWSGEQEAELTTRSNGAERKIRAKVTPAKKWTVLIVPHEHLDIGFTDYPDKIAELHSQAVDGVLDLLPTHPEFRWTMDGSWVAEQYLAGRSPDRVDKLLQSVRDRKIILPMQFANQHTGNTSLEGLARSLYPSKALAEKYSLPIGAAHIADVPSYSWSYASVLHDAGVKYFAAASNSWRAPLMMHGRWNEKSPFYWEGPDGRRVMMWYSRAYLQLSTLFGTPQRLEAVKDALPVFLQAYSRPDYVADSAIIFGSQLENTTLNVAQADLVRNWQAEFEYPRLRYSDFASAMESIEKQFGGKLPVYRGDFGPYWEDGFGSDSAHTAIHRGNQQRILTAEKFGTLTSLLDPSVRPDEANLHAAWKDMLLFDEHTWTFVGATTQPDAEQTKTQLELKRAEASRPREAILRAIDRSWAQLEAMVRPKDASIVVFNSLSWRRNGFVDVDLSDGTAIVEAGTNHAVEVETLEVGRGTQLPGFGGEYRRVRFLAQNVPALGYKVYTLKPKTTSDSQKAAGAEKPISTVIENNFYRVEVDTQAGAILSIWDKELKREIVDKTNEHRFGAYVYVTGADDMPNNSLYRYGVSLKPPTLVPTPAGNGKLISSRRTAYGAEIILESSGINTPKVRLTIALVDAEKRIKLAYSIHKESVLAKEAAYIAFPFAVQNPQFTYDTQTAWVNPAKDELAGGSREWYVANHWAAVSGEGITSAILPVDAPLVCFGDIVRGNWPVNFAPKSSTIFSWLMNNYWGTNFAPQQGGNFTFRYEIVTAGSFAPVSLTQSGWNAMTPLESDQTTAASAQGPLPSTEASLLSIDNPSIAASTWKRAERSDETVLRLVELSGKAQTTGVWSSFLTFDRAWNGNLLEDKGEPLRVREDGFAVSLEPFEIKTILLHALAKLSPTKADVPTVENPK